MDVRAFAKERILVLDGAMGTLLQAAGLALGENPELWNLSHPEAVQAVHRAYLDAGSHMILTNTFGANRHKLPPEVSVHEAIAAAVRIARAAVASCAAGGFVALDVGPIGELLAPGGTLGFEEAYALFAEQVRAGAAAGVDAIYIETMTDLQEARCAVLAAKEHSDLPVFCTMSFEENQRTFMGVGLPSMALTLAGLGVDFLGLNCSVGPAEMLPMLREIARWVDTPLILKPNAGLPEIIGGKTVFPTDTAAFCAAMEEALALGVRAVGGCCGTSPEFISELAALSAGRAPLPRSRQPVTAVCSASDAVVIDRVRIIGERINPTGKKRFQAALREGDLDYIVGQAIEQIEAGADILDVNVGLPGIDEAATMALVVGAVQAVTRAPLQIDSSDVRAAEAGLRACCGKAIVNSVNGEDDVLESVLPLVKKYGAMVVGLTLDRTGIPRTAEERLCIARKILSAAERHGIPREDVIIDCLTLTSGAEQEIAYETLTALAMVKRELGVKTALGVSNISFGLPERGKLNQVFLTLALAHGLDLPIINPNAREMVDAVFCYHQLKHIDAGSAAYIARFSERAAEAAPAPAAEENATAEALAACIVAGRKERSGPLTRRLLARTEPLALVDACIIPALDQVGRGYETGELFLPQLLQSAEAAKAAFEVLRAALPPAEQTTQKTIVLATVQGDIHDIGKNIVKVVLENYGYAIVDLGRDVPPERVLEEAQRRGAKLVGLSALMTTTVASMERTIGLLKARDAKIRVMVGGAVLTEAYAARIGADFYAKDAMAAVAIAQSVLG